MKLPILFSLIIGSAIISTSIQAEILLDQVMSREEQKKTGVANLSRAQKLALESWLNANFVVKPKQPQQPASPEPLSLSINVDNGQRLQLSDNSLWEISPDDVETASVWITPFPVKIAYSNDLDYPYLIVNKTTGVSVKARKVPPGSTSTAPKTPTPEAPSSVQGS